MQRGTWFVVADGSRGRIYERRPGGAALEPALPLSLIESRLPTRERVTDRGGQTHERRAPKRHAKSKAQDARAHGQEQLASRLADQIHHGRTDHRFDQLVLVAPPGFLGLLRSELDDSARKLVVSTHAKDIAALRPPQLTQRLVELTGL